MSKKGWDNVPASSKVASKVSELQSEGSGADLPELWGCQLGL